MKTMLEDLRQFKQQPIVIFMLLLKEKSISGPTIVKISSFLNQQKERIDDMQMRQLVLSLTDILENSKTEEEFLQKMEAMEK